MREATDQKTVLTKEEKRRVGRFSKAVITRLFSRERHPTKRALLLARAAEEFRLMLLLDSAAWKD